MKNLGFSILALLLALPVYAEPKEDAPRAPKDGLYFPEATGQSETDEYTRYELLAPETASFKIVYEVAAPPQGRSSFTTPFARAVPQAMRLSMMRCWGRRCTSR